MATSSVQEWKERGNESYKKQEYADSIEHYTKAIDLSGNDDTNLHLLYANRAAAYLASKNYEKVIEDCSRCLKIEPKFVKAYLRLATAQYHLKNLDEALATISKGMSLAKEGGKKAKKNAGVPEFKKLAAKIKAERQGGEVSEKAALEQALLSGGSSQTAAVQEIQNQIQKSLLLQSRIERQMQTANMQLRMNDLTQTQVKHFVDGEKSPVMYQAVGRMFLQRDCNDVVSYLKEDKDAITSEVTKLQKAKSHYQREIANAKSNLKELVPGS